MRRGLFLYILNILVAIGAYALLPSSSVNAASCCVGRACSSSQLANYIMCSGGGVRCSSQQDCNDYTGFRIGNPGGPAGQGSSFDPGAGCGGISSGQVSTAIGCIPTDASGLFGKFFTLGIGIAGGIAFLLILFGGFQILTSTGNPEKLAEGKELVTSAITGLLMIIFSVFLLQVIGVDILCVPGFGSC